MKKQISAATTTNNTASMTYDDDGEEDVEREEHRRNVEEAEWLLSQFFQMPPAPPAVVVEHDNSSTSHLEEDDEEEIYMETCSTPPKEGTFAEKPKAKGVFTRQQKKQWSPTSASTSTGIPKSISFQSTQPPPQPSKKTPASRYTLPPPPHTWPQRPVFVRANPRTGTQIVGIRYNDNDKGSRDLVSNHEAYWDAHAGVPVNDGYEAPDQTIVVDFVSKFFVGSLLVRIRGTPSHIEEAGGEDSSSSNSQDTDKNNGQSSSDNPQQQQPYYYFAKRQRTFQSVLRGQFRRPLAITDCLTGQEFRRPPGSLPAHWIVAAFEAVLKRIAPHNVLDIEGRRPRSLAPLVTTAQTIQVRKLKESQQEKEDDHDPQGLVLYDGSFFYDSDYDYYNPCYDSNPVEHMAQEWPEPHASHEKSIVCDANRSPDEIKSPPAVDDSQKNRKFRKAYFNKKFDVWKKQREEKEQQEEMRKKKDTPTNQEEGNNASNGDNHDNDHEHDALYQFTTDKEYTFEFYEHLLNFDNPKREVELDMKLPFLHHIPIAPITDGQPIVIMATIKKDQLRSNNDKTDEEEEYTTNDDEDSSDGDLGYLWNFEIWHESLYPYACRAMQKKNMQE